MWVQATHVCYVTEDNYYTIYFIPSATVKKKKTFLKQGCTWANALIILKFRLRVIRWYRFEGFEVVVTCALPHSSSSPSPLAEQSSKYLSA